MDPIISFWVALGFIIILGLGLLIDIVLAVLYWEEWPRFFRVGLASVPWYFKDLLKICIVLIFIHWTVYLAEYLFLKTGMVTKEALRPVMGILNTVGLYILSIGIVVYYIKRNYHVSWAALGIKWRFWLKKSFKSVLFYLGFIPILAILTYISIIFCSIMGIEPEPHRLVEILKEEKSIWYFSYLVIIAVFIAPIFEEIIFRSLIYQTLRKRIGIINAIIVSSVVFSLLHFNAAQFLPVLGLGILLCFIFEYTASLIPAIAIHILNNGLFLGLFLILKDYV